MRKRIGDFFIEKGVLSQAQVEQVVHFSKENGLRFGEAALEMGLVGVETLIKLFGPNYRTDFFNLERPFFPEVTRDLFAPHLLIKFGVLPLGFKTEYRFFVARKILNLGMLNPGNAKSLSALEIAAREKLGSQFHSIRPYLILADQFFDIMHSIYKVTDDQIRNTQPAELDETVALFIGSANV